MDFSLTETEADLAELCRTFAQREIAPRAPKAWARTKSMALRTATQRR